MSSFGSSFFKILNPRILFKNLKRDKSLILRPLLVGFCVAFCLFGSGCAESPQIVNVPVKCSVDMPQEPTRGESAYETIRDLMAYLKQIKPIIKECINDTSEW